MPKSRDLNIDKTLNDVVGEIRRPKLEPETGWARAGITAGYEASTPKAYYPGIQFENNWVNATTADEAPASWWVSESGEGRLRGKVRGGAIGTTVFTLPEEVRPEYVQEFICSIDDDGNIDLSNIRFRTWANGDTEA